MDDMEQWSVPIVTPCPDIYSRTLKTPIIYRLYGEQNAV